jgi:hypothetical protein
MAENPVQCQTRRAGNRILEESMTVLQIATLPSETANLKVNSQVGLYASVAKHGELMCQRLKQGPLSSLFSSAPVIGKALHPLPKDKRAVTEMKKGKRGY